MGVITDRLGRDLSRLELAGVLIALGVVVAVLLPRLDALLARVEAARLQATLTHINTSLQIEVARRIMQGRDESLGELAGSNPFAIGEADIPPELRPRASQWGVDDAGYAGEISDATARQMQAGQWYFDREGGLVIYRVEHEDHFHTSLGGVKRARFRVALEYHDGDGDGAYRHGVDRLERVALVPVERFEWR